MALTPRNIWTPDGGDTVDLLADMSATAVSVDNAIDAAVTEAAQSPVRTFTTVALLNGWSPPDGTFAYVTADGVYYVRAGGAWRRMSGQKVLAEVPTWYMQESQTVTLSEPLTAQPNGIILQWQGYNVNEGVQNSNFQYQYVPKYHVISGHGTGVRFIGRKASKDVTKYVYVTDSTIGGHADNDVGDNRNLVLTAVIGY